MLLSHFEIILANHWYFVDCLLVVILGSNLRSRPAHNFLMQRIHISPAWSKIYGFIRNPIDQKSHYRTIVSNTDIISDTLSQIQTLSRIHCLGYRHYLGYIVSDNDFSKSATWQNTCIWMTIMWLEEIFWNNKRSHENGHCIKNTLAYTMVWYNLKR